MLLLITQCTNKKSRVHDGCGGGGVHWDDVVDEIVNGSEVISFTHNTIEIVPLKLAQS